MSVKGTKDTARIPGRGGPESRRGDAAAGVAADGPAQVRNVALIGHSGAGKTLLIEALLAAHGMISRKGSIADGTTVSDSDSAAVRQQRSVGLAVVPLLINGIKVNLLDTPGYPDFIGELRAGLRAADAALFVVSAVDGIDATTTALWGECEHVGMPRAVAITRVDHPRADYDGVLAACQQAFGESVVPLYVPVRTAGEITGLLGLLQGTVSDYSDGETGTPREANPGELGGSEAARGQLIEGIIAESEDETLMDRYLGGEDIDTDVLVTDLETAVARGSFFPVLPTSAVTGLGAAELMEVLTRAFPSPLERGLPDVTDLAGAPAGELACDPVGSAGGGGGPHHALIRSWAGSAWSGCSRARCMRTRPCMLPATDWRTAATRTMTRTSGSRICIPRWAPTSGRWRTALPATSVRWPNWEVPRPATPSLQGNSRCCCPHGRCPSR